MGDYFERIDKLVSRSKALSNAVARSDMLTMCNAAYDIATE